MGAFSIATLKTNEVRILAGMKPQFTRLMTAIFLIARRSAVRFTTNRTPFPSGYLGAAAITSATIFGKCASFPAVSAFVA